jgi:ribonucleoside-diphosphate reductase beta chain
MYNLYYKMAVLLQDNPIRFVLFPIPHDNLWQFYKKAEGSFWTAEEIDMSGDATDWESLKPSEQDFILNILGFFAASDGREQKRLIKWPTQFN